MKNHLLVTQDNFVLQVTNLLYQLFSLDQVNSSSAMAVLVKVKVKVKVVSDKRVKGHRSTHSVLLFSFISARFDMKTKPK
jgi:Cdc6-like AAA superfamily ATPase